MRITSSEIVVFLDGDGSDDATAIGVAVVDPIAARLTSSDSLGERNDPSGLAVLADALTA